MKTKRDFFLLSFVILMLVNACQNDETNGTGTLIFTGVPPFPANQSTKINLGKSSYDEPIIHVMHTANFKGFVTEIWVSQGLVTEYISDDFIWYKIGESN
ncbi:MAG: hypothetical protein L6422_12195, partial [Candidatus Marinimicrobia bacterium]|nr:hypothetical protein [bacterium]MCG2717006.1 hypothetical protein [Candidatus Neomarinimicrobiota bacterium]